MAKAPKPIDVGRVPELVAIAERVRASGEPCVLTRDGEELAILTAVSSAARRHRKSGVVSRSDSLWNIVGMGRSEGSGDIAENKHKYLAEAYADTHG